MGAATYCRNLVIRPFKKNTFDEIAQQRGEGARKARRKNPRMARRSFLGPFRRAYHFPRSVRWGGRQGPPITPEHHDEGCVGNLRPTRGVSNFSNSFMWLALAEAGHTTVPQSISSRTPLSVLMRKSTVERGIFPLLGAAAQRDTCKGPWRSAFRSFSCGACLQRCLRDVTEADLKQWGAKFRESPIFVSLVSGRGKTKPE